MIKRHYLNLGGGQTKIADAINIDFNPRVKPDVCWDLNNIPYPFPANTFDGVFCHHILEHLNKPLDVLIELQRLTKQGGFVEIISPHFSSVNAYTDPTHTHFFGLRSFLYLTGSNEWSYYIEKPIFRQKSAILTFPKRFGGFFLHRFFLVHPLWYEEKMAWIFPAENIVIELEIVKENPKS